MAARQPEKRAAARADTAVRAPGPVPAFALEPAALLDALPGAVIVLDGGGTVVSANAGWERLLGLTAAATLGRPHNEFIHPSDCDLAHEVLGGNAPDGARVIRYLGADGDIVRLEVRRGVSSGHAAGDTVALLLTDCSERLRLDERRQADHRTLETLVERLPGMVYRCRNNPSWTMEFASAGATELTGYLPRELVNNNRLPYADLIVPADRQRVWDEVQNGLREHRPFELVYRIGTADGQVKWVMERGRGNFSSTGELLGLEGFVTDISAEKHAELRRERSQLHDAATGCVTTALYIDRLQRALLRAARGAAPGIAVLCVYLDRLALLRKQLGFDAAESIATAAGRRFMTLLGPTDSICRQGEDEFALIIEGVDIDDRAANLARRLQDTLHSALELDGASVLVSASIGIAIRSARDQQAEDLLREAGNAMARARERGGARSEIQDRAARTAPAGPSRP